MARKKSKSGESINRKELNPKAFGLALGIFCAAAMLFLSLWVLLVGTGQAWISLTSAFYFGYSTSLTGILLGMIYGFIDGVIGGYIFAWLYNKLS